MNHQIVKNILLTASLLVFTLIISTVYINFFCFHSDILLTSDQQPGFFELEACPYSTTVISTALMVYSTALIIIGFFQLYQSVNLRRNKKEAASRELSLAAKLIIIIGAIIFVYLSSHPTTAWLIPQRISF